MSGPGETPAADVAPTTPAGNVTDSVIALLRRFDMDDFDGYDDAVAQRLPTVPADPKGAPAKHEFASKYKEVGNDLFKQGKHAWALRTYITGVTMLSSLGYEEPSQVVYDFEAHPVCVASYSNGALMALKLKKYELATQLCNSGLLFDPHGAELAKLLLRKAQAALERPQHSDPDHAIELLQRAASEAPGNRPVLELLARAKHAAKEKAKAADRALFGGKGFGEKSLTSEATGRADAAAECARLLRQGWAALFGTSDRRDVDPYAHARLEMEGLDAPKKDGPAASFAFAEAEATAKQGGMQLRPERAHALFGQAAVASAAQDWERAAKLWAAYLELADELCADGGGGKQPPSKGAAGGAPGGGGVEGGVYQPPVLGVAYAHFHAGMARYSLREAPAATHQLERYLSEVRSFVELKICVSDEWGNELFPDLEKELQRQRQWVVSERVQFEAHRRLAHLRQLAAQAAAATAPQMPLREAEAHLTRCVELAWEKEQLRAAEQDLERVRAALAALDNSGEVDYSASEALD